MNTKEGGRVNLSVHPQVATQKSRKIFALNLIMGVHSNDTPTYHEVQTEPYYVT